MDRFTDSAAAVRYRKRSDLIAAEIKRWIASENRVPGDRLPQEKELARLFHASKGTIREALKSLEVQGLVAVSPGPGGGAALVEVPERNAMQLLANYIYFKPLTTRQIYELRKMLEPAMAASAAEHLEQRHLVALERIIEATERPTRTNEQRWRKRLAELEFHDVIAEACPNSLLSFICRFLNVLLRDVVVYNETYKATLREFSRSNLDYHRRILDAFRQGDHEAIYNLMAAHMTEAETQTARLRGEVEMRFLPD